MDEESHSKHSHWPVKYRSVRVSSDRENREREFRATGKSLGIVREFINQMRHVREEGCLCCCPYLGGVQAHILVTVSSELQVPASKTMLRVMANVLARTCEAGESRERVQAQCRHSHLHKICVARCSAWPDDTDLCFSRRRGTGLGDAFDFSCPALLLFRLSQILISASSLLPHMVRLRCARRLVCRHANLVSKISKLSVNSAFSKQAYGREYSTGSVGAQSAVSATAKGGPYTL